MRSPDELARKLRLVELAAASLARGLEAGTVSLDRYWRDLAAMRRQLDDLELERLDQLGDE